MEPGTIALDIDGTITDRSHLIPGEVAHFFEKLNKEGWEFIFVTGRPLSFAMRTLPKLTFPYLLGVQNGADLLKMPGRKKVGRFYLDISIVKILDSLYEKEEGDFLVYSGFEKGDICYFRPEKFSQEMQTYLKKVETYSDAPWIPLKTFDIKEQTSFPLIKCFGTKKGMEDFEKKLQEVGGLKTTLIKDPLSEHLYLILITHSEADKGIAALKLMDSHGLKRPLITGGDDNNDIPLLKVGDVRIAMEGAPEELCSLADIIAPPGDKKGIIKGLEEAFKKLIP